MLDRAEDDLARPDRRLEHRGDGEQEVDRRRDLAGGVGVAGDQLGRDHDDEEIAGRGRSRGRRSCPSRCSAARRSQSLLPSRRAACSARTIAAPIADRDHDLQPVRLHPGDSWRDDRPGPVCRRSRVGNDRLLAASWYWSCEYLRRPWQCRSAACLRRGRRSGRVRSRQILASCAAAAERLAKRWSARP